MKNNNQLVLLKFISRNLKSFTLKIKEIEINNKLEDNWGKLEINSIASLKQNLLKIKTSDDKILYLIAKNVFMIYKNEHEIELRYKNMPKFFEETNLSKEEIKELKTQIQNLKRELELNKLYDLNDLSTIELNYFEKQNNLFELEAIRNFSLKRKEANYEN
ncbi:MSC_0621 family F1-like ATPase epsilon subunit [Mycoplasmopsis gallinarum]